MRRRPNFLMQSHDLAFAMKIRFWPAPCFFQALILMAVVQGSAQEVKKQVAPASTELAAVEYRGGMVSPPLPKPKFTLTDTSNNAFNFALNTQGYAVLLFFGYTHCPDMCPLEMRSLAQAFKELPPDLENQFKVVFVTTDPGRDTAQVLRAYLDHFDKKFIGLTGNQSAIDAAQIAADLPPAKKTSVRPDGSYDVGHASFVLAYTKDNLAHVIYPVGVKQEDLVHDLRYLANESWANRSAH